MCQETETRKLEKTDHDWSEWKITTKPSCTTEGEETRQCSVCQETETRKLEKTAHNTEIVGAKAPSCTSEGYTGDEVCKDCHAVVKKGHKLDKTAHQDVYKRQHPALETWTDFFFPALSLLVGVRPAHEHKCFAEGKASMFTPISEMIPIAVNLFLNDGAVRIRSSSC